MKKIIFIGAIIILIMFNAGGGKEKEAQTNTIKVVTTLFPLYDFAKNIGQDKVEAALLLPPGVEAHAFEPKPSDLVKINEADLFVYTGKLMEPWTEDVLRGINNKNLKIVNASLNIDLWEGDDGGIFIGQQNHQGEPDPHFWLDFFHAKKVVENIKNGLDLVSPMNKDFFQKNSIEYEKTLIKLDQDFQAGLSNCQTRTLIQGGHFAFGYLARRYNLKYLAAQGFSPDSEPMAKDLIALVEQIKRDNIKYVFYEELTSPKIAETIAGETSAELLLLNAAHNLTKENFANNVSFISIMEENLKNLRRGLQCNN